MYMAPRVVFRAGEPSHSICPWCGEVIRDFRVNPNAVAFGQRVGRMWKMALVQKGFVTALGEGGVTEASAKRMFKVLKLALVLGLIYLMS